MAKSLMIQNIVLLGHPGCGKSTLTGHFMAEAGSIDPGTIDKLEEKATKMGKNADVK